MMVYYQQHCVMEDNVYVTCLSSGTKIARTVKTMASSPVGPTKSVDDIAVSCAGQIFTDFVIVDVFFRAQYHGVGERCRLQFLYESCQV